MDEMNQDLLRDIRDLLKYGSSGSNNSPMESSASSMATVGGKFEEALKKAISQLDKLNTTTNRSVKEAGAIQDTQFAIRKTIETLNKKYKDHSISLEKYEEGLRQAQHQIIDLGDSAEDLSDSITGDLKKQIERSRKEIQEDQKKIQKYNELKNSVTGATGAATLFKNTLGLLSRIGGVYGKVIHGLQDGMSGIDIASGVMTAGIDLAGDSAKLAGSTFGTLGGLLTTTTNPAIKGLGYTAEIAGSLISGLGNVASKAAKFGVEILQKEANRTVKAFQDATQSGALFTDGMNGLRTSAGESGLTLEQFSGVVKQHATDISAAGLGVGEGVKKVGKVMVTGGTSMKESLLKLGFSFEDQAGLVAETMKDMRGATTGPLRASNIEVAEQTAKYAENLRVITAITGEDAKKKAEQVREQASQLAFQQKLAAKTPEQQAATLRAMANMTEVQSKNFMDMVNFGVVVNKGGAILASQSPALADSVFELTKSFNDGSLDEYRTREINAKRNEQIQKDTLSATGIARAGAAGLGGVAADAATDLGKLLQELRVSSPEAIKAAEQSVEGQKNAVDETTTNFTKLAVTTQALQVQLQNILSGPLKDFSKYSKEIIDSLQTQVNDINKVPGVFDKFVDSIKEYSGEIIGALFTFSLFGGKIKGLLGSTGVLEKAVGSTGALEKTVEPTLIEGAKKLAAPAAEEAAAQVMPEAGSALASLVTSVSEAGIAGIAGTAAAVGSAAIGFFGTAQALFGSKGVVWGGTGDNFINDFYKKMAAGKIGTQVGNDLFSFIHGSEIAKQNQNVKPSLANGGIATGPTSGFDTTLHGTELVLPLAGSSIDTSSKGFQDLAAIVNQQLLLGKLKSPMTINVKSGSAMPNFDLGSLIKGITPDQDETAFNVGYMNKIKDETLNSAGFETTKSTSKSDTNQQMVIELRKIVDLLSKHKEISEEGRTVFRQILEAAIDQTDISKKIYQATV